MDLLPLSELKDFLANKGVKAFRPGAVYFPTGDFISANWKDEQSYSEQISPELTIVRSMKTGEVTGCKIYGIKLLRGKDE